MKQKKSDRNETCDLLNTRWALYPLSYENSWKAGHLTEFVYIVSLSTSEWFMVHGSFISQYLHKVNTWFAQAWNTP